MKIALLSNNKAHVIDGVGDYANVLYHHLLGLNINAIHLSSENTPYQKWIIKDYIAIYQHLRKAKCNWLLLQYVPYSYHKLGIPYLLIFFCILLRFSDIRIITTFHEVAIRPKGIKHSLVHILQKLVANTLAYISFANLTSIDFYKKNFSGALQDKIVLCGIPSNFENILSGDNGLRKETFNITSLANRINKNSLDWMDKFKSHKKNIHYHILGKKPGKEVLDYALQIELADNLTWYGELAPENFVQILNHSDVYLQLDALENNIEGGVSFKSGALAAALYLKKFVIAFKGDMTSDLLVHGKNIFFLNSLPQNKIMNDLARFLNDDLKRESVSKMGKELYDTHLSWDKITEQYLSIIKKYEK